MSNLKDKILNKDMKVDKDKITVSISLKECTWKNGDRPVTVNNKSVLKMLIDEGYEVKSLIEGDSLYNDLHNYPDGKISGEWIFSLKTKKTTTKTQTKKKAPTKTNLTKETKSVTVTQEDQQKEDSESVE